MSEITDLHDAIGELGKQLGVNTAILARVETQVGITNGRLTSLESRETTRDLNIARVEGIVNFARWAFTATLGVVIAGAAVAGVVVAVAVGG